MSDAPVALRGQEKHLVFKGICGQRPSVTKNDRLTGAPVFVVNLRSIFGSDNAHLFLSFWCWTPYKLMFANVEGFCADSLFAETLDGTSGRLLNRVTGGSPFVSSIHKVFEKLTRPCRGRSHRTASFMRVNIC